MQFTGRRELALAMQLLLAQANRLLEHLGHIPTAGETVQLTAFDPDDQSGHPARWLARVVRMDGRRIDLLALTALGAVDG